MTRLPDDRCPRCGEAFHCGMHDPAPCPCSTLTLPPALLARLKARYTGCLCLRCLATLAAAPDSLAEPDPEVSRSAFARPPQSWDGE